VAIARALAARPRLLLMDEPFSSLDAITREKLQEALLAAWREVRAPYVIVTHSVEEAVLLGRRILLVGGCPARIGESFDNPGFGARGYREQDAFFDLVRRVRAAMGRLFP
jgi:NitT/TauT family transport system ATP-binding protein